MSASLSPHRQIARASVRLISPSWARISPCRSWHAARPIPVVSGPISGMTGRSAEHRRRRHFIMSPEIGGSNIPNAISRTNGVRLLTWASCRHPRALRPIRTDCLTANPSTCSFAVMSLRPRRLPSSPTDRARYSNAEPNRRQRRRRAFVRCLQNLRPEMSLSAVAIINLQPDGG